MANLVDRTRLARIRARARDDGMFLQHAAATEVKDRLDMVNRRFTQTAVVTGFPDLWRHYFPEATIVADNEILADRYHQNFGTPVGLERLREFAFSSEYFPTLPGPAEDEVIRT